MMDYKLIALKFLVIMCVRSLCHQMDNDIQDKDSGFSDSLQLLQLTRRLENPLFKLLGKSFLRLKKEFRNVEDLIKEANLEKQLKETSRIEKVLELKVNETESRLKNLIEDKFDTLWKVICKMYTCSEWTEWSSCDAVSLGEYGLKNRTRECGRTHILCSETANNIVEEEKLACQTVCPSDYNMTLSGYCVKLYKNTKSRDLAEKQCQTDGGHLINIDSFKKSTDITDLVKSEKPQRVWIGGIQHKEGGDWVFSYGSGDSNFTNWHYDQPNDRNYPNCMYLLPDKYEWADYPCHYEYSFLCEIVSC